MTDGGAAHSGGRIGEPYNLTRACLGARGEDPAYASRPAFSFIDGEHARCFAWGRAETTGELGKIVRDGQLLVGVTPAIGPHRMGEVRDRVAERAALRAERNATIHAAPSLLT